MGGPPTGKRNLLGDQQRRTELSSGGNVRCSRTLFRMARNREPDSARRLWPSTHVEARAMLHQSCDLVRILLRTVPGPCTAEYGPRATGKKKIAAAQSIATIANS